ncbi:(d)CMP kinase [Eudoraea chungangensis]|uniref:(d)CMP kinase n=1 Tax=Eudoraea chungangensis TaxID=1481905 RepID=UPI0023EA7D78|nr:(d)CMP kinase [Eudoraea chungangensis]
MEKITIAIDGYSSTGKSTVAKQLAKALGYLYVDSGAMYRAITLFALRNECKENNSINKEKLIALLQEVSLEFKYNEQKGYGEIYLNNENVEGEIRNMEVSELVSKVSAIPEVREKLVAIQKDLGHSKGVVMDGRDIGTVVFPDAELKVFMTASPATRAARRYKELLEKGEEVTYSEILKNVEERDYIDSHREISPLRRAEDAVPFDNSDMGLLEQFERIHNFATQIIDKKKNAQ